MKSLRNFIIALAATFGCIVYAQAQKYALVDMEYILLPISFLLRLSFTNVCHSMPMRHCIT